MGPGRSSSLRIGGDSSVVSDSGRTSGASDCLAGVAFRDVPGEPPLPLDKVKGRIDEIKYPVGSEYLKSAVQNVMAVRPSRVEKGRMGKLSRGVTGPLLVSRSGLPTF